MEQNKISIIIPVYNVEKRLDTCLESVCNQTYQNIEIILINDGSTDKSGDLCDKWKKKDSRIIVVHKSNEGVSAARNDGICKSTGDYILFVDSDDTIDHHLLEKVIHKMNSSVDMVIFGYNLCYEGGKNTAVIFKNKEYFFNNDDDKLNFILGPFFRYETGWSCCNRIFSKDIIQKYDIRFPYKGKVMGEDKMFCLSYIAHSQKIFCMEECLYDYYQSDNSIMRSAETVSNLKCSMTNSMSKALLSYYQKWDNCKHLVQSFPAIHYLIMERSIQEAGDWYGYGTEVCRKEILDDIAKKSDYSYFIKQMNLVGDTINVLKREYSNIQCIEKYACAKWLLGESSIICWLIGILRRLRDKLRK